jgi:hypothetical protein
MGELAGMLAIVCIFGMPIFFHHQRKMLEIKMKSQGPDSPNLASELREIKNQMAELRDTTTRYDMSFDSALQRLENRMGNVEQRLGTVEQASDATQVNRN